MATIEKITPEKGKVGHVAVLHGTGLAGTTFLVKFGKTPATDAANPGNSPDTIKCTIPVKDALDPGTVGITVTIDGIPATVAPGVTLEYGVPQPEPVIKVVTGVTRTPPSVAVTVTVTGTDFVKNGRTPDTEANSAYLVDADPNASLRTVAGTVQQGFTESSLSVVFSSVRTSGTYALVVGFTDGAAATSPSFQVTGA